MLNLIKMEILKGKRTSINKIIFIIPLFLLIVGIFLGQGQHGYYNWFYTLISPMLISLISAMAVNREKKLKYKGVFLNPINRGKIWTAKIIYSMGIYLIACIFVALIIYLLKFIPSPFYFKEKLGFSDIFLSMAVIYILNIFQIPFMMILGDRTNSYFPLIINIFFTILGIIKFATLKNLPYIGLPRAMILFTDMLPNGLPFDGSVQVYPVEIFYSALISIGLFIVFTLIGNYLYKRKEVK